MVFGIDHQFPLPRGSYALALRLRVPGPKFCDFREGNFLYLACVVKLFKPRYEQEQSAASWRSHAYYTVRFGVIQIRWGRGTAFKPKRARDGVSSMSGVNLVFTCTGSIEEHHDRRFRM